jgi:hypothetical protein
MTPITSEQNQLPSQARPFTDSPWLWFTLFSAVGLAALIATGGRLGRRQSDIERKYQARAAVASGLEVESGADGGKTVDADAIPEYSTPQKTVIPLWPLEIILGVVCAGSFYLLLRERMGPRVE